MQCQLAPCPFCDARHITMILRECRARCQICGAEGPIGETAEQGGQKWNERSAQASDHVRKARAYGPLI